MMSGREVAQKILEPAYEMGGMEKLFKKKRIEERILDLYEMSDETIKAMYTFAFKVARIDKVEEKTIAFLSE